MFLLLRCFFKYTVWVKSVKIHPRCILLRLLSVLTKHCASPGLKILYLPTTTFSFILVITPSHVLFNTEESNTKKSPHLVNKSYSPWYQCITSQRWYFTPSCFTLECTGCWKFKLKNELPSRKNCVPVFSLSLAPHPHPPSQRETEVDKWKTNRAVSTLKRAHYKLPEVTPPTRTPTHTHTAQSVISWHMWPDIPQRRVGRHGGRQSEINTALYVMRNFVQGFRAWHLIK